MQLLMMVTRATTHLCPSLPYSQFNSGCVQSTSESLQIPERRLMVTRGLFHVPRVLWTNEQDSSGLEENIQSRNMVEVWL